MTKYTKLDFNGDAMPANATGHLAVRVEHPLLANPITVTAHRAPNKMTYAQAVKWAESLEINGWSWRLPTVDEAFFLADRGKYPALDVNYFPDFEEYEWIWTSTPDAEYPSGDAWVVGLHVGSADGGSQAGRSGVRAVRAGQYFEL